METALDIRNEARKKILQRGTRATALVYADARKEAKLYDAERKRNMRKISFMRFKIDTEMK
jgi:hypothetical protein